MSIKLVIDSASYITKEYCNENDITVVPYRLHFKDKDFVEGFPGEWDEFFETLMSNKKDYPKTSQPSVETFQKVFQDILDQGNEVVCITLASYLSGCNNGANLAKNLVDKDKITVIDSETCLQAMGIMVKEAVEMIKTGKTRQEIADLLDQMKSEINLDFTPETLEYLKRGGRLGPISAVIGKLLNLKPILTFNKNVLSCSKKVLGTHKAIIEMVNNINKNAKKILLLYIHQSKFLNFMKQKVQERFPNVPITTESVGPLFGAHVGPGTIGIVSVI